MLRKAYKPVSMFLEALALLIIGILFLTNPEGMLRCAVSVVHILAWIAALNSLFKWLTKRDRHRPSLFHALLMLGLAVFLSARSAFVASSAYLVFAVWVLLNAFQSTSMHISCGKRKAGEASGRFCKESCIRSSLCPCFPTWPAAPYR